MRRDDEFSHGVLLLCRQQALIFVGGRARRARQRGGRGSSSHGRPSSGAPAARRAPRSDRPARDATSRMRRATSRGERRLRLGHDTCCSEIELHHQHAVVRGLGDREMERRRRAGEGVDVVDRRLALGEEAREPREVGVGRVLGGELGGDGISTARCASMISRAERRRGRAAPPAPRRTGRGLPRAMRAPPPAPILISTMPSASSVRSASRATMRLAAAFSAMSFSVPRKSPGASRRSATASRTSPTMLRRQRRRPAQRRPPLLAGEKDMHVRHEPDPIMQWI